jgi:hypothetical protein
MKPFSKFLAVAPALISLSGCADYWAEEAALGLWLGFWTRKNQKGGQ